MEEEVKEEETKGQEQEQTLPPYPDGLLDWSEDEKKVLLFKGEKTDTLGRLRWQVWHLWLLYGNLRNSERLVKAVNTEEDFDKNSDEYFLRLALVQTVDRLGKVLSSTGEMAELFMVEEKD